MYHVFETPNWLGPTDFYDADLRALLDRNERMTWEPIHVWAASTYPLDLDTMPVTFQASAALAPPSDRQYFLELLHVPDGVTGAPPVGMIWALPLDGQRTVHLPTYRTTDGLTGYQFAFTMTKAEPGPGDLDNDGDVDQDDFAIFGGCFTGLTGEVGPDCEPEHFSRSDVNHDADVDLADFAVFTANFTGLLASRPTYVGAAACIECHEENHAGWSGTIHATAFDTLIGEGEEGNRTCFPCHTVGYGEASGFVNLETTPDLANVQCESCHGPGSHHAADADNVGIKVDLDAAMCGACHQSCHGLCGDYYHPHFEQWSTSKHSIALAEIRWLPEYEASCLSCHSTDYRLAPEDDKPGVADASYSLECVACHTPHGSVHAYQLRLAAPLLCAQCHTMGDAVPGDEPERPHVEFWHGVGGFALDGTPLDGLYTIPYLSLPGECAFCHVYREVYGGPDQPANSGHTFESNTRACNPCHSETEAAARIAGIYEETEPRLATIARYLDPADPLYVDPTTLGPEELAQYNIARFDYELVVADASFGAHNADYARRLLEEAETFFGITP